MGNLAARLLRSALVRAHWAIMAATIWMLGPGMALAQEAGEEPTPKKYVLPYILVVMVIGVGVAVAVRPRNRSTEIKQRQD